MSALGQKQTFAVQYVMSDLHPKADMCGATRHVCFVPIADMLNKLSGKYSERKSAFLRFFRVWGPMECILAFTHAYQELILALAQGGGRSGSSRMRRRSCRSSTILWRFFPVQRVASPI